MLVGTVSVEESGRAGRAAGRDAGIVCDVLNAQNDEAEARIIAAAGALGAVTISTNMAGRGTDIRLGGGRRDRTRAGVDISADCMSSAPTGMKASASISSCAAAPAARAIPANPVLRSASRTELLVQLRHPVAARRPLGEARRRPADHQPGRDRRSRARAADRRAAELRDSPHAGALLQVLEEQRRGVDGTAAGDARRNATSRTCGKRSRNGTAAGRAAGEATVREAERA